MTNDILYTTHKQATDHCGLLEIQFQEDGNFIKNMMSLSGYLLAGTLLLSQPAKSGTMTCIFLRSSAIALTTGAHFDFFHKLYTRHTTKKRQADFANLLTKKEEGNGATLTATQAGVERYSQKLKRLLWRNRWLKMPIYTTLAFGCTLALENKNENPLPAVGVGVFAALALRANKKSRRVQKEIDSFNTLFEPVKVGKQSLSQSQEKQKVK